MDESERYLFDLRGYLVVRSALTEAELETLRAEIKRAGVEDALAHSSYVHAGFPKDYFDDGSWAGEDGPRYASDSFILDWGPGVRSLVAHRRLVAYLRCLVGPSFRLDHAYGVFARGRTGPHPLHGGGTPFDPSQMYLVRDGQIFNSMVGVQIALTDTGARDGGFCCIPGSHKANFPLPKPMFEADGDSTAIVTVPLRAGDALIFTEALTHGALGWTGDHDRLALLFKYCDGATQWERDSPFVSGEHDWTDIERRVLTPPYAGGRPTV